MVHTESTQRNSPKKTEPNKLKILKANLRRHIEKITPLTDEEFEFVFSHFKTKKLKKHQYTVQEGELVNKDFWVLSGLLKAYFTDNNGKQYIMQFAMEDWWITDYQAYFNKTKATINIDCLEATELLYITLSDREKLCDELHKMANFFRKKSNSGYVALQHRILTLLSTNSQERYIQLLDKYPALFQRVPKSLIASYLGVSRETLSRLNSK